MLHGELDIDEAVGVRAAVRLGLSADSELPAAYHATGGWIHPWSPATPNSAGKECGASDGKENVVVLAYSDPNWLRINSVAQRLVDENDGN